MGVHIMLPVPGTPAQSLQLPAPGQGLRIPLAYAMKPVPVPSILLVHINPTCAPCILVSCRGTDDHRRAHLLWPPQAIEQASMSARTGASLLDCRHTSPAESRNNPVEHAHSLWTSTATSLRGPSAPHVQVPWCIWDTHAPQQACQPAGQPATCQRQSCAPCQKQSCTPCQKQTCAPCQSSCAHRARGGRARRIDAAQRGEAGHHFQAAQDAWLWEGGRMGGGVHGERKGHPLFHALQDERALALHAQTEHGHGHRCASKQAGSGVH